MNKSNIYKMLNKDALVLLQAVNLPVGTRKKIFKKYTEENGVEKLINLFANFMGLANSVVENNRDALEMFLICEKGWYEKQSENINLPTIFGALNGVKLANATTQKNTCHGCACRFGTLANQSPATTLDVDYALSGDGSTDKFYCHENLDENGNPTQKCRGFTQIIQSYKKLTKGRV